MDKHGQYFLIHNDTGMRVSKPFLSISILVNYLLVIIAKEIYLIRISFFL